MKKRIHNGMLESVIAPVLSGLLAGVAILLAGALLISWLISAKHIGEGAAGYGILANLLLSGFISAMMIIGKYKGNRVAAAAISAAGLMILLLLANFLLGIGSLDGFLQTALVVFAGSACALFINNDNKKKRRYHFKK